MVCAWGCEPLGVHNNPIKRTCLRFQFDSSVFIYGHISHSWCTTVLLHIKLDLIVTVFTPMGISKLRVLTFEIVKPG